MANPFEILKLAPSATEAQVKDAYRELSKQAHPDAGGSAEAFQALKAAYEQALDLAGQPRPCEACGGKGRIPVTKGFSKLHMICNDCGGKGSIGG